MGKHREENLELTGELFQRVSMQLFYHLMPEYGPALLPSCWTAIDRRSNNLQLWTVNKALATRMGHDVTRIREIARLMVGIQMKLQIVYLDVSGQDRPIRIHFANFANLEFLKEEGCPYLIVSPQSVFPKS